MVKLKDNTVIHKVDNSVKQAFFTVLVCVGGYFDFPLFV